MEFEKPEIEEVIRHTFPLLTLCLSPDQTNLCSAGIDFKVILTNLHTIKFLYGHKGVIQGSDFSSNGKYLVTASDDGTSRIWNVESENGNCTKLEGHLGSVRCVRYFRDDATKVISGSNDYTIKIWDIERKKEISTLNKGCFGKVFCVDILPDNHTIVSGDSHGCKMRIWDSRSGKCVQILDHHSFFVSSVQFHPNTFSLASGSYDNTVKIIDFRTYKLLQNYQEHTNWVRSVSFHPSGNFLLSGSDDCTIKLYDLSHKKVLYSLNEHRGSVLNVQFSADGKYFVSGSRDRYVAIWNFPLGMIYGDGNNNYYKDIDEKERVKYLLSNNLILCDDDEKDEFCEHDKNAVLKIRIDDLLNPKNLYCFKFSFLVTY